MIRPVGSATCATISLPHEDAPMTDSQPAADEPTPPPGDPPPSTDKTHGSGPASASGGIMDSIRDAFDDIAERAAPTVKEYSAKAAELTATAADKAAPLARKAGEATADASGKLAEKSRAWASDIRAALGTDAEKPAATETDDPERPV